MSTDLTDAERSFIDAVMADAPPTLTDGQLDDLRAVLQPKVAASVRLFVQAKPRVAAKKAA